MDGANTRATMQMPIMRCTYILINFLFLLVLQVHIDGKRDYITCDDQGTHNSRLPKANLLALHLGKAPALLFGPAIGERLASAYAVVVVTIRVVVLLHCVGFFVFVTVAPL